MRLRAKINNNQPKFSKEIWVKKNTENPCGEGTGDKLR